PSIFLLLGGHHSSLNSDEVINDKLFDAICVGEGEKAILSLVDSLSEDKNIKLPLLFKNHIPHLWIKDRKTNKVFKNPTGSFQQDLDGPYIIRRVWDRWIERPDEYPSILLGRGCPYKCTYCSNHAMAKLSEGLYVRFRSPKHITGELDYIRNTYPKVDRVILEVETFGANRKASYAVFDALREYNRTLDNPLMFSINMALTSNYMMNPERRSELFEKARAANITTINIGLESGSERMRKIIARPKYTNKELIEFCKDAKTHNIRIVFFVLLGLPGETIDDYYETVKVVRLAQPHHCYVSIFFPYLGTDLANTAIDMGLIDKEHLSPRSERSSARLNLPDFSNRRIRFEYIVFFWRAYKGIWPILKVVANVIGSFLKAYPEIYSFYWSVRNNFSFIMKLTNKYNVTEHKLKEIKKTVNTREDVFYH
ncbi:MAG: radical SAM protein, partial [SAR202 cluster bacterium]|nr:radical SAM protein [SAR202 cluster bacterium]